MIYDMMSENGWFLRHNENGDGENDDQLLDGDWGALKSLASPLWLNSRWKPRISVFRIKSPFAIRKARLVPLGHVALSRSMVDHHFLIIFSSFSHHFLIIFSMKIY